MKSKKEIEKLADKEYWAKDEENEKIAFRKGYTQCQEDVAKEIEILKIKTVLKYSKYADLGRPYIRLLNKLNKQD